MTVRGVHGLRDPDPRRHGYRTCGEPGLIVFASSNSKLYRCFGGSDARHSERRCASCNCSRLPAADYRAARRYRNIPTAAGRSRARPGPRRVFSHFSAGGLWRARSDANGRHRGIRGASESRCVGRVVRVERKFALNCSSALHAAAALSRWWLPLSGAGESSLSSEFLKPDPLLMGRSLDGQSLAF
jgi:hypothetical protein